MKEYNLWLNLKRNLAAPLWQRIETGGTGRGIPDVFGAYKGVCCWVELKIARGNKVHLTPEHRLVDKICTSRGANFHFSRHQQENHVSFFRQRSQGSPGPRDQASAPVKTKNAL